jgi:hypothetical protein
MHMGERSVKMTTSAWTGRTTVTSMPIVKMSMARLPARVRLDFSTQGMALSVGMLMSVCKVRAQAVIVIARTQWVHLNVGA